MGDPDHGTEGTGGHVAHQICSTTRGTQSSVCSSVCHTRFSLSQTRCRIAQQGVPGGPGLSGDDNLAGAVASQGPAPSNSWSL